MNKTAKTFCMVLLFMLVTTMVMASTSRPVEIHVVKKDTLTGLCNRYLAEPAKWREVAALNRMLNPDLLLPGQIVKVPVGMLKGMPFEATVSFIKGDVQKLPPDSQGWQQVKPDELIADGTEISTGAGSSVELTFDDGSSVLIHQESRLKVISSQQGPLHMLRHLRLEGGKLITRIKKATGKESRFEIETPSALAAARGTSYRVTVDSDQTTRTEVLESVVEVMANGQTLVLQQGEGSLVKSGETPGVATRLLPPPQPLEVPPLFGGISNSIRFSNVEGAAFYNVTLAKDQAGKDVVKNSRIKPDQPFSFQELADGDYYLFTSSIGDEGLEGEWSDATGISVKRKPLPPSFVTPLQGADLPEVAVSVQWHNVVGAASYQLQLAKSADFSTVLIDSGQVEKTVFRTERLTEGEWYIRIRSFTADNYGGDWSHPRSITVKRLAAPELAAKADDKGKLYLEWLAVKGAEKYRVQLSENSSFQQPLVDQVTDGNSLVLEKRPAAGQYFTRIAPVDRHGDTGGFSQNGSLTIERDNVPLLGGIGVLGGVGLILLLLLL